MASRSLRKLTREPPTAEDVQDLISDLSAVDDRATAVIAGIMVEDALSALLLSGMITLDKTARSELFGPDKPLSGFAAKIRVAHAFGLCDTASCKSLTLIKDIRNTFVHAPRRVTFDTPAIADAVKKLTPKNMLLVYARIADRPIIASGPLAFRTKRNAFLTMCLFYEINLRNTIKARAAS